MRRVNQILLESDHYQLHPQRLDLVMKLSYSIFTAFPAVAIGWILMIPLVTKFAILLREIPVMDYSSLSSSTTYVESEKLENFSSFSVLAPTFGPTQDENCTSYRPQFEILSSQHEFKVVLDIPGVRIEDVNLEFDENNSLLTIRCLRNAKGDGYSFTSQYSQTFLIDSDVIMEQITREIDDNKHVLVVSAPKNTAMTTIHEEFPVEEIPVTYSAATYNILREHETSGT